MQPKRRQKDRPRRSFFVPRPQPAQGLFRAPWRERFLCLRRPHFFQQRKKWGKERRQKLRFCTSSARYAQQRFPAYSRGQSPLLSLSVKRTACTFTGAEADAAACFSHGRRFSLLPPSPKAFPLDGSAVLNDRPVACQIRGPTDPQGDRWRGEAVTDEVSLVPHPAPAGAAPACRRGSAPPARAFLLSPTAPFLPTAEEMGERTPAETAFLHFLSAQRLFTATRAFPHATGVFLIVVVPPTVPAQLSAAAARYYGKKHSFCCVAG